MDWAGLRCRRRGKSDNDNGFAIMLKRFNDVCPNFFLWRKRGYDRNRNCVA